MRRPCALFLLLLLPAVVRAAPPATALSPAPRYDEVVIEPAKTFIYIGSVTLKLPPLLRHGPVYETTYEAKVFPYFFFDEYGRFSIDCSDDDLRRLAHGETVQFHGRARNSGGENRRIEGSAQPVDATQGRIKVRIFVGRLELIFNTTYRFTKQ